MTLRRTALIAVLGVGAMLWLIVATHEWGLGERADGSPRWKYLLEDVHDRNVYQQRGRWLPSGLAPYAELHSEYPQLATLLLGVPYLFFDSTVPVGRPQTTKEFKEATADRLAFNDLSAALMATGLLALILLTAATLRELGESPGLALLLFLPGTLYFSFNRFDAWPSLMVVAALLCQLRGRTVSAAALLGLGAMTKWYPILLLPLFLSQNLYGRGDERPWLQRVPKAILLPGLVAAGVCAAFLAHTFFWHDGGLEAVKYVYGPEGQGDRKPNPGSIVFALTSPQMWGWFDATARDTIARLATLAQFAPAMLLAFVPIRGRQALLAACLVVVLSFMQFGKVFSPQWIVWLAPLAILVGARARVALLLLVVCDLLTWLHMPLFFYEYVGNPAYGEELSSGLSLSISLRIVALALFWAWSLWTLLRTLGRPQDTAAAPSAASR